MRALCLSAAVLFLLLLGAPGVAADDGKARTSEADAVDTVEVEHTRMITEMNAGEADALGQLTDVHMTATDNLDTTDNAYHGNINAQAATLTINLPAGTPWDLQGRIDLSHQTIISGNLYHIINEELSFIRRYNSKRIIQTHYYVCCI